VANKTPQQAAVIRAYEMYNQTSAVRVSLPITFNMGVSGINFTVITVKKFDYDATNNTLIFVFNATVNGNQKAIHNPLRIYNPIFSISNGPNVTATDNPLQALKEMLYSVAQISDYGKPINDDSLSVYITQGFMHRLAANDNNPWEKEIGATTGSTVDKYTDTTWYPDTLVASTTSGSYKYDYQAAQLYFDTHTIGSGTVTSASLTIPGITYVAGLGKMNASLIKSTFTYSSAGTVQTTANLRSYDNGTLFSVSKFPPASGSTYWNFTSTGISLINTSGYTGTVEIMQNFINMSAPTWASGASGGYSLDLSSAPMLYVVYSTGGAAGTYPVDASFSVDKIAGVRNSSRKLTNATGSNIPNTTEWYGGSDPVPCVGNLTGPSPTIFPVNFSWCSICEIAHSGSTSNTSCMRLYVAQPFWM
jgi:hypothetical protein